MNDRQNDPPALVEAIRLLREGFWPVPISTPEDRRDWIRSPGKQPANGKDWGKVRFTEGTLRAFWRRYPRAGVGLKMGKKGRVIDLEIDEPDTGENTLLELLGGEVPETRGWDSARGRHLLFLWDDRLESFGGVIESDPRFPGLGLRFGSSSDDGDQVQSVVPPSPITRPGEDGKPVSGEPRAWNEHAKVASLPEYFFEEVARRLKMAKPSAVGPRPGPGFVVPPDPSGNGTSRRWYLKALENEAAKVSMAPEGTRHNTLRGAACTIGGYLHLGHFTEHEAASTLRAAAEQSGMDQKDIEDTIQWGFKKGKESPFDTPNKLSGGIHPSPSGANNPFVLGKEVSELEWEPPHEIEPGEVVPFPLDVFPEGLQELCRVASQTMQSPVDYFAAAALGLASGVVGRTVALRVTSTWEVMGNLYLAIVGPPGSKKSPALKLMAGPLWKIDQQLRKEYREEKERLAEYGDKSTKVVHQHLTLDDATRESVARALSENPRGLAIVKDELTGWVASQNQYRQGKGDDKQFWMSLNTGSLVKVTRKGSDEPIVIPHPCASVVGCLTPDTLPSIKDGHSDDGWLDRILFSYPAELSRHRRWNRDQVPEELLEEWTQAVNRLWSRRMVLDDLDSPPRPYYVQLSEAAESRWEAFYNAHHDEQCAMDFPTSLRGPWSKLEGYTLRLALTLSMVRYAYDGTADIPSDIDPLEMWGAEKLIRYFKCHFRRARGEITGRPEGLSENASAVLRWITDNHLTTFTAREVLRQFRTFDDRDRRHALDQLLSRGYIRLLGKSRQGTTPGRHSIHYAVNPHITTTGQKGYLRQKGMDGYPNDSKKENLSLAIKCLCGFLMTGPEKREDVFQMATEEEIPIEVLEQAASLVRVIRFDKNGVEHWRIT